ncbi:hypothetical protein UG55_112810, partial [Frankia sp. EI5c]
ARPVAAAGEPRHPASGVRRGGSARQVGWLARGRGGRGGEAVVTRLSDRMGHPGWRAGSRGPASDGSGPVPGHRRPAPATSSSPPAGTSARGGPVEARPPDHRTRPNPPQRRHQGFQSPHRPRNSPHPPPRRPSTGVRRRRLRGSLCLRSRRGCASSAVGVVNTFPEEARRALQSPHRDSRAGTRNAGRRCQITERIRLPPLCRRPAGVEVHGKHPGRGVRDEPRRNEIGALARSGGGVLRAPPPMRPRCW